MLAAPLSAVQVSTDSRTGAEGGRRRAQSSACSGAARVQQQAGAGGSAQCCLASPCLQANVARLKAYRSNVVIFPRNVKKPKVGALRHCCVVSAVSVSPCTHNASVVSFGHERGTRGADYMPRAWGLATRQCQLQRIVQRAGSSNASHQTVQPLQQPNARDASNV